MCDACGGTPLALGSDWQKDWTRTGALPWLGGIIHAAYKRGNVVIVGRGGQAIFREMPSVLHVRIQAPLSARVQRTQDQENVTPQEAQEVVSERDRSICGLLEALCDVD